MEQDVSRTEWAKHGHLSNQHKDRPQVDTTQDEAEVRPNRDVEMMIVNDGVHNSNSVVISSRPKSYIFNIGEGFQIGTHYGRATRSDNFNQQHIFVTHSSWKNLGGLLGYLQTSGHGCINHVLHGPAKYKDVLNSIRRTTTLHLKDNFQVDFKLMGQWHTYHEDSQVRIDYVKLKGKATQTDGGVEPRLAYAYIVKPKRLDNLLSAANLIAEKLVALKIKWGPMTDALREGKSITLENGKIVTPQDVQDYQTHKFDTGSIVILECPSEEYIDSVLAAPEFEALSKDKEWVPDVIVHMSPVEVVEDQRYKKFMKRFKGRTIHLLLNEKSQGYFCPLNFVYRKSLTEWNPYLFPAIWQRRNVEKYPRPKLGTVVQGFSGQLYNYRLAKWAIPKPRARVNFRPVELKNKWYKCKPANKDEFPEIVFLGTGSSRPHTFRNVIGILIQIRRDEYMILDCGENTLRQMHVLYGVEASNAILQKLKAVFVSHKHFDHLGGLPSILDVWNNVTRRLVPAPTLQLLVPIEMKEILKLQKTLLGCDLSRIKIHYHNPLFAWHDSRQQVKAADITEMEEIKKNLGFSQLLMVQVPHQKWFRSYGIVMQHMDGWKLVYTGDTTVNCKNLIEFGQDCDILIHEATFPNYLWRHAKKSGHCTSKQAIEHAEAMNAKYTILTHFSSTLQRELYTTENVGVSFDLMKFRPSQARELSGLQLRRISREISKQSPKLVERMTMKEGDWDDDSPPPVSIRRDKR